VLKMLINAVLIGKWYALLTCYILQWEGITKSSCLCWE